ncbi:MAG: glycoside hydrolase family 3 C-terminal domain-containing protein [Oscillospiraceae bacterium]|nr:glycoside hydrolase family 3 C-terminal domain-containing protein [Oscillospiraceae bacterium]
MSNYKIGSRTVDEILSQMTLEEKAKFLDGRDFWHTENLERLGVPAIMVADGPHGMRKQDNTGNQLGLGGSVPATSFPTASCSACSWDVDLLEEEGKAIADEARSMGVSVVLGPGVNMKRSPLCGRNFEYFSEDPYLAGELGAAWVRGAQKQGVGTSLKHYAVNNQESRRLYIDAVVDERALREIYLPAFETVVVKEQPWTVMNSYNKINGYHGSENNLLQNEILREEWGFQGMVVSDWSACKNRVDGVKAGNDLEMPSSFGLRTKEILDAVAAGHLDMKYIDIAVKNILVLIAKSIPALEEKFSFNAEEHHELARKIAGESIVLLKNEGRFLPLDGGRRICVIGEMAKAPRYQGSGSSQINPSKMDNFCGILDGLGVSYSYSQGYDKKIPKKDDPYKHIPQAVQAAKNADIVLLFVGLTEDYESESFDRTSLDMPAHHNALINEVAAANPNTVVVFSGGSPVSMPWLDKVPAVLNAYLAGQAGAGAVWDVLTGKVNPSGKLAESFPLNLEDVPSRANFPGDNLCVQYRESLFIGYRYYDKLLKKLQFPFGYGLSYTDFEYSNLALDKTNMSDTDTLKVSCTVKNIGGTAGKEIVQLYVKNDGKIMNPPRALKGFTKVFLNAGESKEVSFELSKRVFAIWDTVNKEWRVPSGDYEIQIGASSADIRLYQSVSMRSQCEPAPTTVPPIYLTGDMAKVSEEDFAALMGTPLPPKNKPHNALVTIDDTFELAGHTKWGGRILKVIRFAAFRTEMGGMLYAEATQRPFRDILYFSGGLFSLDMTNGLLQILNNQGFFRGLWRILRGLPHLLLNIKKLLRLAF